MNRPRMSKVRDFLLEEVGLLKGENFFEELETIADEMRVELYYIEKLSEQDLWQKYSADPNFERGRGL